SVCRESYLLMVRLFLWEPKSPCMRMMGAPAAGVLGLSWRWYANDSAWSRGRWVENEREVASLVLRSLRISAPVATGLLREKDRGICRRWQHRKRSEDQFSWHS